MGRGQGEKGAGLNGKGLKGNFGVKMGLNLGVFGEKKGNFEFKNWGILGLKLKNFG